MTQVLIKRRELFSVNEVRELHGLHSRFFVNSRWQTFIRDFGDKDWVIVVTDDNQVVGFSTIAVTHSRWEGEDLIALFSGDTIVHPEYWQSNLLIPAFGQFILHCHQEFPGLRLVWHLISKGYRTYRILPVFFNEYFPGPHKPTPPVVRRLLDHLSTTRFADHYDASSGIVSFNGSTDCLCERLAEVLDDRKSNPHIRFFLERNPGYRQGDELSCLTDLGIDNIKPLALKMISRSEATWIRE